ncbi:MAG: tRNA uridine-5-carboxymethylaminomethyl(34) synthesis GTPase MnmE [Deltaproteobacteria bacterium]|nr:MAG: tRNA uridine-5-carboxymethylaminomethyl(34) synthesis GTPase MnmE [Deltaproteobacteria bacterium]
MVAPATPPGRGGVGVVRISGPDSARILRALTGRPVPPERRVVLRSVKAPSTGETIDRCLVCFFRGPASYTGEDVVEISAHGNPLILKKICEAALEEGARMAQPGEFTRRAFLNGKLDLSQAEAVAELVEASSDLSLQAAMRRLDGGLREETEAIREIILEALVHLESAVDFPEEELEIYEDGQVAEGLRDACEKIEKLLATARAGRILTEGARVTICGRPNVGKSSLLNALLKEERAIVSKTPGTTRDFISETLTLRGVPIRVIDTAGIRREWGDAVEKEGILRSSREIESADLILFVVDGSQEITDDDRYAYEKVRGKEHIVVVNKTDLPRVADLTSLPIGDERGKVFVSARTGEGMERLEEAVSAALVGDEKGVRGDVLVGNMRQKELLEKGREALHRAIEGLQEGRSPEFVSLDVREAAEALGEIVGRVTTEDVLERIFSTFCIGK